MALTTVQMQANLDAANAAYLVAVNSAQYTIGNRSKSNQDLNKLQKAIQFWSGEIAKANRGGIRIRGITTT
jgi:hypothetical protein